MSVGVKVMDEWGWQNSYALSLI